MTNMETLKALALDANMNGANIRTIEDLYNDLCHLTITYNAMVNNENDALASLERAKKALTYISTSYIAHDNMETIKAETEKAIEKTEAEIDRLMNQWDIASEAIHYIEESEQWDLVIA